MSERSALRGNLMQVCVIVLMKPFTCKSPVYAVNLSVKPVHECLIFLGGAEVALPLLACTWPLLLCPAQAQA